MPLLKRLLHTLILALVAVLSCAAQTDLDALRRKQQQAHDEAVRATRKLEDNRLQVERQLNRLDVLRADIEQQQQVVKQSQASLDSVNRAVRLVADSIVVAEQRLDQLRDGYAHTLRQMQLTQTPMSKLAFILSSESMAQAYRRVRYLRQFSVWRAKQAAEVRRAKDDLEAKREQLTRLARKRANALERMQMAKVKIESQEDETRQLIAKLQGEQAALADVIKRKEAEQQELDRHIDSLIRQEQERAERQRQLQQQQEELARLQEQMRQDSLRQLAEAKAKTTTSAKEEEATPQPTAVKTEKNQEAKEAKGTKQTIVTFKGDFAANKGKLLFPVAGKYKIVRKFGRQKHPTLEHVETDNAGIDIEAQAKNASARAVFPGKVSAIFQQPGFNSIVMVRHGSYITIYAGLETVNVKNEQELSAGENIGRIYADPAKDNARILHFELRHERNKLNPTDWLQ